MQRDDLLFSVKLREFKKGVGDEDIFKIFFLRKEMPQLCCRCGGRDVQSQSLLGICVDDTSCFLGAKPAKRKRFDFDLSVFCADEMGK